MHSEHNTKRRWGIIIFLSLVILLLAGCTLYLSSVRSQWRNDIRRTMDANVEYGGKMSLVEETRKKRIEFFLLRSIRELPHKTIFTTADFIKTLEAFAPQDLEFQKLSIIPRLHTLWFSLRGSRLSVEPELFAPEWRKFLQRLEEELPVLDLNPTLSGAKAGDGEFVIEGELELQ